jgi:tetratricopeptide (TPR) repeat protein/uncharacterized protein YycO
MCDPLLLLIAAIVGVLIVAIVVPAGWAIFLLWGSRNTPFELPLSEALRHLLQPGDVIVVGHQWPFAPLSNNGVTQMANAMTEDITHRYWTHAALYSGNGWIWEATRKGVQPARLKDYLNVPGVFVRVRRNKEFRAKPDRREDVIDRCRKQKGACYDFWAPIYNGIVNLYPASFATILVPRWIDRYFCENKKFACAELVVHSFADAGMGVPQKKAWRVKPADFITSDLYVDVPEEWEQIIEKVLEKATPESDVVAYSQNIAQEARRLRSEWATRSQWENAMYEAVDALIAKQHFEEARGLLDETLVSAPNSFEALWRSGFVLGKLGEFERAQGKVSHALKVCPGNAKAQGILGKTYKALWRRQWETEQLAKTRREAAINCADLAKSAIESYHAGHSNDISSYYNGINVVTLSALLRHLDLGQTLSESFKVSTVEEAVRVVSSIEEAVRVHAVDGEKKSDGAERIWALATMGELELVAGDSREALEYYRKAIESTDTQPRQISSMLDQIEMLASLDFRPQNVAPIREYLSSKAPRDPAQAATT